MKKYLIGFMAGGIIFIGGNALASLEVETNPLFDPIDPETGEKLPKDLKAPKIYTQAENDFTMLYGRLDFLVKQLDNLQETCAKR